MAVYNCKDVTVFVDGINLSDKGFSNEGDFLTVTPPSDIADVTQDKSGEIFVVTKNNNAIGEIKFSIMQNTPAQNELKTMLKTFRKSSESIDIIIDVPAERTQWIMKYGVFDKVPEHGYSTKNNTREYTFKGNVYDQNQSSGSDVIDDVTDNIVNIANQTTSKAFGSMTDVVTDLVNSAQNGASSAIRQAISDTFF